MFNVLKQNFLGTDYPLKENFREVPNVGWNMDNCAISFTIPKPFLLTRREKKREKKGILYHRYFRFFAPISLAFQASVKEAPQ